jgi:hypothetical protein
MNQTHGEDLPVSDTMRKTTSIDQRSPDSSNRPLNQEQDANIPVRKLVTDPPRVGHSFTESSLPPPDEKKQTQTTTVTINARSSVGWERAVKYPWLVPHDAEDQKHAWHDSSLGMGSKVVMDEWGFHSTSVSRSPSPNGTK